MKIKTYAQAIDTLSANPARGSHVYSRLLAGNTRLHFGKVQPNSISLVFYDTAIVTWYMDGRIILNSGGYRTVTTKRRMCEFGPVHVYQHQNVWYVEIEIAGIPRSKEFSDGMNVSGLPVQPDLSRMKTSELPLTDSDKRLITAAEDMSEYLTDYELTYLERMRKRI